MISLKIENPPGKELGVSISVISISEVSLIFVCLFLKGVVGQKKGLAYPLGG